MSTITKQPRSVPARDWRPYSRHQVAESFDAQLRELRARYAELLETLVEMLRRENLSRPQAADLLRENWHLSGAQIKKLLAHAGALTPQLGIAGATVPTLLPATRDALNAGEISDEHVTAIVNVFRHCPDRLTAEGRATAEAELAGLARTSTPGVLRHRGARVVAAWNPEKRPARGKGSTEASRRLAYWQRKTDGAIAFRGHLDSASGAVLVGLVEALGKALPAHNGKKDTRSRGHRNGDALAEILRAANDTDDLVVPYGSGTVRTAAETPGGATSTTRPEPPGTPGSADPDTVTRVVCTREFVLATPTGDDCQPDATTPSRESNAARLRTLASRDGGCTFPGCSRSPKWCHAHQLDLPQSHSPDDIDDLVLLCEKHHRYVHHGAWEVRLNHRDKLPEFIPPTHVDPNRRPLRNHVHSPLKPLKRRCRKQASRRGRARHRGSARSRTRSRS